MKHKKRYTDIVNKFLPRLLILMDEFGVVINARVDGVHTPEFSPDTPGVHLNVVVKDEDDAGVLASVRLENPEKGEKWHSVVLKPSYIRSCLPDFADRLYDELNSAEEQEVTDG